MAYLNILLVLFVSFNTFLFAENNPSNVQGLRSVEKFLEAKQLEIKNSNDNNQFDVENYKILNKKLKQIRSYKSKVQVYSKISKSQSEIDNNRFMKKRITQRFILLNGSRDECEEGYIDDCSGDGDCCPESWIGDGLLDCEDPNNYGCDLTCYDNDGGDCEEGGGDGETDGGDGDGGDGDGGDCDFFDCVGTAACGYEEWIQDGICDEGSWGIDYNCEEFNFDEGDCTDGADDGGTDGGTDGGSEGDCDAIGGNETWIGDAWCDDFNNNETCGFDGGDCCYSTCVSADYDCEADSGPCVADICIDPDGNNDDCINDGDDGGQEECGEGTLDDCSGDGDCCPESWIGDGLADCEDQPWGCDLTCYDNDGGDCTDSGDDGGDEGCYEDGEFYCYGCELFINDCEYLECTWEGWVGPYTSDSEECSDGGGDDGGDSVVFLSIGEATTSTDGDMPGEGIIYGAEVPVYYESSESVGGIQFTISDSPDWTSGVAMSSVFEDCFTGDFNDVNGGFIGILFSLEGCELDATESSTHFATILFELHENAEWGSETELFFSQAIVSDGSGNALSVNTEGGSINVSVLGDVSSDSEVNVLDVISLINFILMIEEPTDYQHWAADVNGDTTLNVLDVVVIVDIILE